MDKLQSEVVGFYRMMVVGQYHNQLQSYKYEGDIKVKGNLYYYNREKPNKKLVLFLNGGTQFNTGHNIEKIISHLLEENVDYDIACYINASTYNLLCVNDICKSIRRLGYKEIDIVGLSVGTLIASHVIHKLIQKGTTISLKLICIDPIMNMYESAKRTFDTNYIHRPDLLQHFPEGFFNAQKKFKCKRMELLNLTTIDKYVAFLGKYYDLSRGKYQRLVRFKFDLPGCQIHLIHTIKDPVVLFEENHYQYRQLHKPRSCSVRHYFIDEISHCTLIQSHPELQMAVLNKCIRA